MQAIVVSAFGDEEVLQYTECDMPEPGPDEVRVRVEAAGVNPVDTYIRAGTYVIRPPLPYIPGADGAGVIDAVGGTVRGLRVGMRVFIAAVRAKRNTGTYAEYCVCDAEAVRPLPEGYAVTQGAGLGTPGLAASCALFPRAGLRPGETVLVHGASGGVGTLAVQLARQAGAVVIGTAGSREGERLVKAIGAHHVFNHSDEDYLVAIRKAVPAGPDVIMEMLANENLGKDLSLVAQRGRIVIVGSRGAIELDPRNIMVKDANVNGILLANMTREVFIENMYRLCSSLENGLRVLVRRTLPLRDAARAHREVMSRGKMGKIVLVTAEGRG